MVNWLGERVVNWIAPTDTVLDLGCGNLSTTGRIKCATHLAVDAFWPYLEAIKDSGPTMWGRLPHVLGEFPDKSYDWVLLLDVLEHCEGEHHALIVEGAERVARKGVVVFSPEGMEKQDAWDAWGLGHNPWQEHISAVYAEDFRKRGYDIKDHTSKNHHGHECKAFLAVKRF